MNEIPPLPIHEGVQYVPLDGFLGYCVGSDGSVWSCRFGHGRFMLRCEWKRLRPMSSDAGYLYVCLYREEGRVRVGVHIVVLRAFVGPCPLGMEARHLDGVRSNNCLVNLCWGTPVENAADKCLHGTMSCGEFNGRAKLTSDEVRRIRLALAAGSLQRDLAQHYGVSQAVISSISLRKTWKGV